MDFNETWDYRRNSIVISISKNLLTYAGTAKELKLSHLMVPEIYFILLDKYQRV